jgi:hypothetical protein
MVGSGASAWAGRNLKGDRTAVKGNHRLLGDARGFSTKKNLSTSEEVLRFNVLVRLERFERPTPRFVVWCSIQLSYKRKLCYSIYYGTK